MNADAIAAILREDVGRMAVIQAVAHLALPDWWIGAGFVRNAVWDKIYGTTSTPLSDVDVVYFRSVSSYANPEEEILSLLKENKINEIWEEENSYAEQLKAVLPEYSFEVKNQARMHVSPTRLKERAPYKSSADAIGDWIETATCVGVRMNAAGQLEILAEGLALSDVLKGIVRPTKPEYRERALERATTKGWFTTWPALQFEEAA